MAGGKLSSPVLIGRDEFMFLARRRLAEAADGAGQLLFVAGEAGIGKSRLLAGIAQQAQTQGFLVGHAAAFPDDSQSSAGLLLELASCLTRTPVVALHALGRELWDRLRALDATSGDAHRRRRLLVQDLADMIASADPGPPVLMILEDLHWADQLSLDVLGHLAARLRSRSLVIAGAYRSDELFPRLPMRELRSRLISQRLAEEIRLTRLGRDQTAHLIGELLGRPVPSQVASAVFARSDGIPLHVEELLAAIDAEALTPSSGAAVQAASVPDTLSDAVLTRAQLLRPKARHVAAAAAVIGRSFDFDLLAAVVDDTDQAEVAVALRELEDVQLVVPGIQRAGFDFRHALIRDTLYADLGVAHRRELHVRVARTAAERGYRDAFVSAHFEHAAEREDTYRYALRAAREAMAMSAHSEALELYRRALGSRPDDQATSDQAALLVALGDEAAATDDNEAAAKAYRAAHELLRETSDVRTAAALVPRMVAVDHLLGEGLEARVAALQSALDSLEGVPGAGRERARLRSALAAAYMLDRRLDEAIAYGEQGRTGSLEIGDTEAAPELAATLGSVLVFAGRMAEGWRLLEGAVADARAGHQEAEAARGYRMLGTSASVLVEYDRAEGWLVDGIQYAETRELWNHRHYMTSHLAHVQWATGQWAAATETAQHALADGRGGLTTQITAQYVLGYLALGRGDWATATELLQQALASGERMAELQRFSPPLWGLAEVARCRGDYLQALQLCDRGFRASADVKDAAYLFPYLLTGVRAQLGLGDVAAAEAWASAVGDVLAVRDLSGPAPAIEHARGLILTARGELAQARAALESARDSWRQRRRFWEGGWAEVDLATLAARARRRAEAAQLLADVRTHAGAVGAQALVAAADQLADSFDRGRSAAPWYPLSAREFEVAQLVASGLTNRMIAERLVLAPKTISAHVEHILTKLGAGRRTEIATWCGTVDIPGVELGEVVRTPVR